MRKYFLTLVLGVIFVHLNAQIIEVTPEKYVKVNQMPVYIGDKYSFRYFKDGVSFRYQRSSASHVEPIWIGSNGLVGFWTNMPSYKLDIKGDVASNKLYSQSSDVRLKSDISTLIDCLDKVKQISSKSYFKGSSLETEYGFLAQDIAKLFPELVYTDKEGYLSINYAGFLPIIVEAIKEQRNIIEAQESELFQVSKKITSK